MAARSVRLTWTEQDTRLLHRDAARLALGWLDELTPLRHEPALRLIPTAPPAPDPATRHHPTGRRWLVVALAAAAALLILTVL